MARSPSTSDHLYRQLSAFKKYIAFWLLIGCAVLDGAAVDQSDHPVPVATPLPSADYSVSQWKERDYMAFDPRYQEDRAARVARLRAVAQQVLAREADGQPTGLSHQILAEMIWLVSSTADFPRMDRRMDDLQASLSDPTSQARAGEQDPTDGSWGAGYSEWFFKVVASYPHLKRAKSDLRFIDRINSPQKLTDYLTSASVSDLARTGIDREREYNESLSNLMRMILRHLPRDYPYDPGLKGALMDLLLHRLRNPATGYWGESYIHDGRVQFVDDLSITFHVVSYLDGDVPDMDKVVATTLAAQEMEFPVGCIAQGQHWDHLNMDVAQLFKLGWPHASDAQKAAMSAELNKLLHWCLTESLQPEGTFKFWIGDNSKEETTYYGAAFLARIGYFDQSERFWTDQDFPEAESVRQRIIGYIEKHRKSGAAGGDYYDSALDELKYKPAQ